MMLGTKFAPLRFASSGTFCSKLCAEALQEAGVLASDVSAGRVTPSGLYALLTDGEPEPQAGPITPLDFAVSAASVSRTSAHAACSWCWCRHTVEMMCCCITLRIVCASSACIAAPRSG